MVFNKQQHASNMKRPAANKLCTKHARYNIWAIVAT